MGKYTGIVHQRCWIRGGTGRTAKRRSETSPKFIRIGDEKVCHGYTKLIGYTTKLMMLMMMMIKRLDDKRLENMGKKVSIWSGVEELRASL